jgi:hypothetical protein
VTGSLAGHVADASGARIAGARITVGSRERAASIWEGTTATDGTYLADALPAGGSGHRSQRRRRSRHRTGGVQLAKLWSDHQREAGAIDASRNAPGFLMIRLLLLWLAAAAAAAMTLVACGTSSPRITFTEVPPAAIGGPVRTATIAGRVEGARPGDRVVLFAKSTVWYVQPMRHTPFTELDADGRWHSIIHLGTAYAAMVVRDDYRPPDTTASLPDLNTRVVAIATVEGRVSSMDAPGPPLEFSGYEWEVRERPSDRGGVNMYSAANASVDAEGALHLKVARRDGRWTSAELRLTRALGYGTYVFVVHGMEAVDPAVSLGMYTFDENARAEQFREMNIDLRHDDGQFVLQPNYLPGNLYRFSVPSGRLSHTIRWEPGVVAFKSMRGSFLDQPGAMFASYAFNTGVPTPGDERVHLAFYYYRKSPRPPQADTEIVIERFQYLP